VSNYIGKKARHYVRGTFSNSALARSMIQSQRLATEKALASAFKAGAAKERERAQREASVTP
jgi:hypothetical protein